MGRIHDLIQGNKQKSDQQRAKEHLKEKAAHAWDTLKESLAIEPAHQPLYLAQKSKTKLRTETEVHHGIHFRKYVLFDDVCSKKIQSVVHNQRTDEFILLIDNSTICLVSNSGERLGHVEINEKLEELIFLSEVELFLGWDGKQTLFLYSGGLKLHSHYRLDHSINSVVYSQEYNDVLTCGVNNLTVWGLRYANRHLMPHTTIITTDEYPECNLHLLTLESTASHNRKAFAISKTDCFVFHVHKHKLGEVKRMLHVRPITATLFFNPIKCLITACLDGIIKVWRNDWQLQSVFIGHYGPVCSLAIYPYGPLIVSSSDVDSRLIVWSLETKDDVQNIECELPVNYLYSAHDTRHILGVCEKKIAMYITEEVYHVWTVVGEPALSLTYISESKDFQSKMCAALDDATVRLLDVTNGNPLFTLLLPPNHSDVKETTFSSLTKLVFILLECGDIVKGNFSTNPGKIVDVWKNTSPKQAIIHCCTVYQYVDPSLRTAEDTSKSSASWSILFKATESRKLMDMDEGSKQNPAVLFVGRGNGHVECLNIDTGIVEYQVNAHEMSVVSSILSNEHSDLLVTAGSDNIVKIWRVHLWSADRLVQSQTVYLPCTPTHVTIQQSRLLIVSQSQTENLYQCGVYSSIEKVRYDHPVSDDHTDIIVDVASCSKMKLFATASEDETLKFWTSHGQLIRTIVLNAIPTAIEFINDRGDIAVGIGNHIYRIDHSIYFTKPLMYKMFSMSFHNPECEPVVPFDNKVMATLSMDDVKRLKAVHASKLNFTSFTDVLPDDEYNDIQEERRIENSRFDDIKKSDKELVMLRDGEFDKIHEKKVISTEKTKQAAMRAYLAKLFPKAKVSVPEDKDDEAPVKAPQKDLLSIVKSENKEEKSKCPPGFFPPIEEKFFQAQKTPVITRNGYIPNSVLLKLIYPPEELNSIKKQFKLPALTPEQLEEIRLRKVQMEKEMQDESEEEEINDPIFSTEVKSSLKEKLQEAVRTPSPSPEPELTVEEVEAQEREDRIQEMREIRSKPEKTVKPVKKIKKLVTRPKPKSPPPMPERKPPATLFTSYKSPSPPPPREKTPLPDYIKRYMETDWFRELFSDLNENTYPKPWILENFVQMILRQIKICDIEYKYVLTEVLMDLYEEGNLVEMRDLIKDGLLFVLHKSTDAPSAQTMFGRSFLQSATQAFLRLGDYSLEVITELISIYLEKDGTTKRIVMDTLRKIGLSDPQKFVYKELDSWELPFDNDPDFKSQLLSLSRNWLEDQLEICREHVEYTLDELRAGRMIVAGHQKGRRTAQQDLPETSAATTVIIDRIPNGATDAITAMEALNYFAESELELYLRNRDNEHDRNMLLDATSRKTVLVLPKIPQKPCLVRLGESHCGKPKRRQEKFASGYPELINVRRQATLSHISFPMAQVQMNPFPSKFDDMLTEMQESQPVLLMLRTNQKYFVPESSYVIS